MENLWASEPCNTVRLMTDQDVEDKIAYVVANPVGAGLVKRPEDWPGALIWGDCSRRVVRPRSYFREEGTCPKELTLAFERPPSKNGWREEPGAWRARVMRAIASKIAEAHQKVFAARRPFLGRAAVLAVSFIKRARTYEQRFGVMPTFAAMARSVREHLGKVERYFRSRYRQALERWRRGDRTVAFPPGTWWMVVLHRATVARARE
jgi:hypothetical protein